MWEFNFEDYKVFCKLTNKKACYYKNLLDYKEFLENIRKVGL